MFLQYVWFILFFILVMLTTHLIRSKIRGSFVKDVVRVTIFYIPFLFPAIFFGFPNIGFKSTNGIIPYIIAVCCALIALVVQFKDYRPLLNEEIYSILPPVTTKFFIISEVSLIGSAFFEEIFYRVYVPQSIFLIEGIVSGGLFCLSHYIQVWTRKSFTLRSYIILFLLSFAWYYSYKISGTILPAILGHLTYNFPSAYIVFRRYVFSRKNFSSNNNAVEKR